MWCQRPRSGEEMEIIRDERTYEGLPAVPALVMAIMESSGIRSMIEEECGEDGSTAVLSAGMTVKALIGAMVERGKRPLYRVGDYFSTAPNDKLFGPNCTAASLSDTNLSHRLDDLFHLDGRMVLYKAYQLLGQKYGFDTRSLFLDGSNYTMFGLKYEETEAGHDSVMDALGYEKKTSPLPAYGGNAKDGRNDLVQMCMSHAVNQLGIPVCCESYSGNTSDITMNEDMIEFLCKEIDMKKCTLVADCKLCVNDAILNLSQSGVRFVTKVPFNFNDKLKNRMISSAINGSMDESQYRAGRKYFQTEEVIDGQRYRAIAYLLPHSEAKAEKLIRGPLMQKAEKALKHMKRSVFHCEADAMAHFRKVLKKLPADCYAADPVIYEDTVRSKKSVTMYRIKGENLRIDDDRIGDAVLTGAIQVLLTNIPFAAEWSEDIRSRACADQVIDLYLEQYKAEAGFKMMKSGMGIADVYIHTPARITAVAFVVSLATMLCKTIDHFLKITKQPGERRRTVKTMADVHVNTIVKYDRVHDRMSIMGRPGASKDVFDILERLGIEPNYLLEYQ